MPLNIEYVRARTLYITSGVLVALLVCAGGAAAYFYQQYVSHKTVVKDKDDALVKQEHEIGELKGRLKNAAGLDSQLSACNAEKSDMEDRIRAFAKQAASCEAIKQKYHFKG